MIAEPFAMLQLVNPMIIRPSRIQSCIQNYRHWFRTKALLIYNRIYILSLKTRIVLVIKHISFHMFIEKPVWSRSPDFSAFGIRVPPHICNSKQLKCDLSIFILKFNFVSCVPFLGEGHHHPSNLLPELEIWQ